MFVVTVVFSTAPHDHTAFLAMVSHNAAQSLRLEPGCHRFDVCTAPDRPGEVFLYELYEDAAAFEAHKAMPHFLAFDRESGALVTKKTVSTYLLAPTAV